MLYVGEDLVLIYCPTSHRRLFESLEFSVPIAKAISEAIKKASSVHYTSNDLYLDFDNLGIGFSSLSVLR